MPVHTPHPDRSAAEASAWTRPAGGRIALRGSAIPAGQPRSTRGRVARWLALGAFGSALGVSVWRGTGGQDVGYTAGAGARWELTLMSGGSRAVTAVAFGRETGVHVVRAPAAGAPTAARQVIGARLGAGDVYLVSLGRDPLVVETTAPPGMPAMRYGARSHFVRVFQNARGAGVRTGWR